MSFHCEDNEFIIDMHFDGGTTHIWTKTTRGETKHYRLFYHPVIYIAADGDYDVTGKIHPTSRRKGLHEIAREVQSLDWVHSIRIRRLDSRSQQPTRVLQVRLVSYDHYDDARRFLLERNYNAFNVDLNRRQHFFIEEEIAPMSAVHLETETATFTPPSDDELLYHAETMPPADTVELVSIDQYDDPLKIYYHLPPIRMMQLDPQGYLQLLKQVIREHMDLLQISNGLRRSFLHRLPNWQTKSSTWRNYLARLESRG